MVPVAYQSHLFTNPTRLPLIASLSAGGGPVSVAQAKSLTFICGAPLSLTPHIQSVRKLYWLYLQTHPEPDHFSPPPRLPSWHEPLASLAPCGLFSAQQSEESFRNIKPEQHSKFAKAPMYTQNTGRAAKFVRAFHVIVWKEPKWAFGANSIQIQTQYKPDPSQGSTRSGII